MLYAYGAIVIYIIIINTVQVYTIYIPHLKGTYHQYIPWKMWHLKCIQCYQGNHVQIGRLGQMKHGFLGNGIYIIIHLYVQAACSSLMCCHWTVLC